MPETVELTRIHRDRVVPQPGTYEIDQAHSSVGFVARHLVVSKVRGSFERFSGTIVVAEEPEHSSVEVTIETASVSTREEQRDAHLRSADFFDAERFPTLHFQSNAVRHVGGGRWDIDGDLTVRDVTRPVTLHAEFNGASPDPFGGGARIGFSAETGLDREEFGLTWNMALETGGVLVGKTVTIEIEVEAVRQA